MTQPPRVPNPYLMAAPPPPRPQAPAPMRIEPVPGTDFGLAYLRVAPIRSGQAIGSMVAGIGSLAVFLVEICLGLVGAGNGWGALVAGAFAILAFLLGAGAVGLGLPARRATLASGGAVTGGSMANAGIICGVAGASLAVLGFAAAFTATYLS